MKNVIIENRPLKGDFQGTSYNLRVFRFGAAQPGKPKAYMHAALHADETPGMLILHHMLPKLQAAAEAGLIDGEIVVLPQANPLGGAQVMFGDTHIGRFDMASGQNHNRGWELLSPAVIADIEAVLSDDETANVAHIRRILAPPSPRVSPRPYWSAFARRFCSCPTMPTLSLIFTATTKATGTCSSFPSNGPIGKTLPAPVVRLWR